MTNFFTLRESDWDPCEVAYAVETGETGFVVKVAVVDATQKIVQGTPVDTGARVRIESGARDDDPNWSMVPRQFIYKNIGFHLPGPIDAFVFELELNLNLETTRFGISMEPVTVGQHFVANMRGASAEELMAYRSHFQSALEVANRLREKREVLGGVSLYHAETGVLLSPRGRVSQASSRDMALFDAMDRELRLLVDTALSQYLCDKKIQTLFLGQQVAAARRDLRQQLAVRMRAQDVSAEFLLNSLNHALQRVNFTELYTTTPVPLEILEVSGFATITSPTNRYTDLVSQRQLRAHLNQESPAYTFAKLGKLASELNHRRTVIESRTQTTFRDIGHASWCLLTGEYSSLENPGLTCLVRLLGETESAIPEALLPQLLGQLSPETLWDSTGVALADVALQSTLPEPLQAYLREKLKSSDTFAARSLEGAVTTGHLEHFKQKTEAVMGGVEVRSSVYLKVPRLPETEKLVFTTMGRNVEVAKSLGVRHLMLVATQLGGANYGKQSHHAGEPFAPSESESLAHICTREGWPVVDYALEMRIFAKEKAYHCVATLTTNDSIFKVEAPRQSSVNLAKDAAAALLIYQLENAGKVLRQRRVWGVQKNFSRTAVKALEKEVATRWGVDITYRFERSREHMGWKVCALALPGYPLPFCGTGPVDRDAKIAAAQQALRALSLLAKA
jgi:hypothetical protein